MKESGIKQNILGSHWTSSASTSKCKILGLSFKEIAKSAGWFIGFMVYGLLREWDHTRALETN